MFISAPVLSILPEPDKWALEQPLVWQAPDLRFTIPSGWITDLASIPAALRGLLDVNGRSRSAALAHDWLYNTQRMPREFADGLFRRALVDCGESTAHAKMYWLGVRLGGGLVWNARLKRGGGLQPDDFATADAFTRARNQPNLGFESMT